MKAYAIYTAAITIALATCLAPQASALDKAPVLSLDLAKKIAAGCEAKATIPMSCSPEHLPLHSRPVRDSCDQRHGGERWSESSRKTSSR
jgi:hypothetical protein